ncbi:hypothetical protein DAMA08_030390 [Martiniozyma asiatica (nom. inval.)]|nr:hypothetical protein DAMA08_030390 [Martiniozyma asiatica]
MSQKNIDLTPISNSLPSLYQPNEQSMNNLSTEISQEFKIAARSIAALYRLSNQKIGVSNSIGYLDCVNDVLGLLDQNISTDSLRDWLFTKRKELTPKDDIPQDYKFTVSNPTGHAFPLTQLPMSLKQNSNTKNIPRRRSNASANNTAHSIMSDSEENSEDDSIEISEGTLKRKIHSSINSKKSKFE